MAQQKALLAMHGGEYLRVAQALERRLRMTHWHSIISTAHSVRAAITSFDLDLPDLLVVDLNLGMPAQGTIVPAQQLYEHVRQHVESGRLKFFGISEDDGAVQEASSLTN